MKKNLKDIKAEPNTIKAQLLEDADGEVCYIKDVAEYGCIGGNCSGLVYTVDCEEFYSKHADEIDNILLDIEEQTGEPYDITGNMKRLNQTNLRNFLAWLAYEVTAQELLREIDPNY